MGRTKKLAGKIVFKHEKEIDWNKSEYIPNEGEKVLYDPDENCPYVRMKFGDGEHRVVDLPFSPPDTNGISEKTHAEGSNTLAGSKGYYYKAIDFNTKTLFLSNEKTVPATAHIKALSGTTLDDDSYYYIDDHIQLQAYGTNGSRLRVEVFAPVKLIFNTSIQSGYCLAMITGLTITTILRSPNNQVAVTHPLWPGTYEFLALEQEYAKTHKRMSDDDFSGLTPGIISSETIYRFNSYRYIINHIGLAGADIDTNFPATDWIAASGSYLGDRVSITNKEQYGDCAHIVNINHNAITLDYLPFAIIEDILDLNANAYTIMNISQPTKGIIDVGYGAHAEGESSTALGWYSHAEGNKTAALSNGAHAEGYNTIAGGKYSHTEGHETVANGTAAHAEGQTTIALNASNHAEGSNTLAGSKAYYWNGIDFENKKIYLSENQSQNITTIGSVLFDTIKSSDTTITSNEVFEVTNLVEAEYVYPDPDFEYITSGNITLLVKQPIKIKAIMKSIVYEEVEECFDPGTGEPMCYIVTNDLPTSCIIQIDDTSIYQQDVYSDSYVFTCSANSLVQISGTALLTLEVYTMDNLINESFTTPEWSVGDYVSLVNDNKYDNCSTIVAIQNNEVTLDSFPFEEILVPETMAWDDYTILNISQPTKGIIDFGLMSHAEGNNSKAVNYESHAEGCQTVAYGRASHAEGMQTEAAYAAHAEGRLTKAKGTHSHTEGYLTIAENTSAHAEGRETTASGYAAHSEGLRSKAIGNESHAEGMGTEAIGEGAHAEGQESHAVGARSHAEGLSTDAAANNAHAEGYSTTAAGNAAHAEGHGTIAGNSSKTPMTHSSTAAGFFSHAEGNGTWAYGNSSHAEGKSTQAIGQYSHAEGEDSHAEGENSHAEGKGTFATASRTHAEGNGAKAIANNAHAEGYTTIASGNASHAEGVNTIAGIADTAPSPNTAESVGFFSHAEGNGTWANGNSSHSEGRATKALGNYSHAEGNGTQAIANGAHAEGYMTEATGKYSHAGGYYTKATTDFQTAIGKYSKENTNALFIVGDGTSESARSNAFEVLNNNNVKTKNLIVENNLTVRGTTTSIESEVLTVADNMIVTNSLGEDIDSLSGLAIRKNQTDVYGIAYDSADDTVKLGLGTIGTDNNFAFNSGDGQAIATREGLGDGDLVEWNAEKNTLVPTQERAKIGSAIVDNNVGYIKDVPEGSAPYAEILQVGGITRKCTNLIDIEAYCKGQGTLNLDGSVTIVVGWNINCDVDYTGKLPSGTYTVSNFSGKIFYVQFSAEDYSNGVVVGGTKTFIYDGVSYLRFVGATQYADESVTYKVMLNAGDAALPYEPFFEGLRSAKVTEVKSVGVNLFDKTKATLYHRVASDNGTISHGFSEVSLSDYINVKGISTFYVSGDAVQTQTEHSVAFFDENKAFISGESTPNRAPVILTNKIYNVPSNAYYVRFNFAHSAIDSIQFEVGATASPYTPYVEHTLHIPEAVRPANGINDEVYDYIEWAEDGSVKKTVKCGVADLGTLDWNAESNYAYSFSLNPAAKSGGDLLYTNLPTGIRMSGIDTAQAVVVTFDEGSYDASSLNAAMSGVMLVYELATPEVTDISDLITSDNLLSVEANGTVTMINEYAYDVPSEITFYEGQSGAVGADTFVGDLIGVASRSIADENGNNITTTYANKVVEEAQYDIAYERSVPSNLPTPWSKVTKIGGMTRKCTNLFDKSKVAATETATGFSFINTTGVDGAPVSIGMLKIIAPSLKVGDNVTFYGDVTNGMLGDFFYLAGSATDWNAGNFHTVTQGDLDGDVFAYGVSGVVCEYNNMRITKIDNAPYEPYFEGLRDSAVIEVKSVGVNLFNDVEWFEKYNFTPQSDGSRFGRLLNNKCFTNTSRRSGSIYITFIAKTDSSDVPLDFLVYYTDGTRAIVGVLHETSGFETKTINTDANKTVDYIVWTYGSGGTYYIKGVSISFADVGYTPYQEHALPIPEAVQALDGYGLGINENLYNYLEWQPEDNIKTWHKNVGVVDLGALDWTLNTNSSGNNFFQSSQTIPRAKGDGEGTMLCSHYTTRNNRNALDIDKTIAPRNANANVAVCVRDDAYTDAVSFKTAMSGVMLVYELATPEVTDISELLPDDNFIRVEEGGTIYAENSYHYEAPLEVTYHVDINEARSKGLTIDNMQQSVTRAVYAETAGAFSGNSLTIGNTTLTEAQLQKLLALLNEIEFA